jgi:hypothetical protein
MAIKIASGSSSATSASIVVLQGDGTTREAIVDFSQLPIAGGDLGSPASVSFAGISTPQSSFVSDWVASAVFNVGQIIAVIIGGNVRYQIVISPGTSDVSAPTWGGSGTTTIDGGVTWAFYTGSTLGVSDVNVENLGKGKVRFVFSSPLLRYESQYVLPGSSTLNVGAYTVSVNFQYNAG